MEESRVGENAAVPAANIPIDPSNGSPIGDAAIVVDMTGTTIEDQVRARADGGERSGRGGTSRVPIAARPVERAGKQCAVDCECARGLDECAGPFELRAIVNRVV